MSENCYIFFTHLIQWVFMELFYTNTTDVAVDVLLVLLCSCCCLTHGTMSVLVPDTTLILRNLPQVVRFNIVFDPILNQL